MSKVFISYRHEGVEHADRVRSLAEELRRAGIQVAFDQFAQEEQFNRGGPPEGWAKWCCDQARSGRVVIVASEGWFRCFLGSEVGDAGLGAAAEGSVLRQRLYDDRQLSEDIRVVELDPMDASAIPVELRPFHRFRLPGALTDLTTWLRAAAPAATAHDGDWPESAPSLRWSIANHEGVPEAVAGLLTRSSVARFLPIEGASGIGKTTVGKHLLGAALSLDWLSVGRLDFKGSSDLTSETNDIAFTLGVEVRGASLQERLASILAAVNARKRPTLLLFDTYEAAACSRWVEETLLLSLIRAPWLRVVIAGQRVPGTRGTPWAAVAATPIVLARPAPEHWYRYSRLHREDPAIDLRFVETVYNLVGGDPTYLFGLLGPKP